MKCIITFSPRVMMMMRHPKKNDDGKKATHTNHFVAKRRSREEEEEAEDTEEEETMVSPRFCDQQTLLVREKVERKLKETKVPLRAALRLSGSVSYTHLTLPTKRIV